LIRHSYDAVLAWEDNVHRQPGNPVLVAQLAWSYAILGDIDFEISGWWRIFERNPIQMTILRLLHQACVRKYSTQTANVSLLQFAKLCAMRLLSGRAEKNGIGHLDWWPLASDDELMMLTPYMAKQCWKNASPLVHYYTDFLRSGPV
jgi:hypothetical protein